MAPADGGASPRETIAQQCRRIADAQCTRRYQQCKEPGRTVIECINQGVEVCCRPFLFCQTPSGTPPEKIDRCVQDISVAACDFLARPDWPASCIGILKP
jgi:hypothetical protein